MAKKKYRKRKKQTQLYRNPAFLLLSTLVVLMLGVTGIQLPEFLQHYFPTYSLTKKLQHKSNTRHSKNKETVGTNPGPIEKGSATFTSKELAKSTKGWIHYQPLDSLGRATGADALITPAMIGTGTSADPEIKPAGFVSGLAPYHHARGHLIGKQLGGSGEDKRNLTTLYQNPVNTPYMTKYENMIRAAVDHGEKVRYRVRLVYDQSELLCKEVRMEAKSLTPNGSVDFNVIIYNQK